MSHEFFFSLFLPNRNQASPSEARASAAGGKFYLLLLWQLIKAHKVHATRDAPLDGGLDLGVVHVRPPLVRVVVRRDVDLLVLGPARAALDGQLQAVTVEDPKHLADGDLAVEVVNQHNLFTIIVVPPTITRQVGNVERPVLGLVVDALGLALARLSVEDDHLELPESRDLGLAEARAELVEVVKVANADARVGVDDLDDGLARHKKLPCSVQIRASALRGLEFNIKDRT